MSVQVIALTLASVGKFSLWGAVLVDVGTALAVICNSLRLLRKRLRVEGQVVESNAHAAAQAAAAAKGGADVPPPGDKPACCSNGKCTAAVPEPIKKKCCDSKKCGKTVEASHVHAPAAAATKKPCCGSKKCGETVDSPAVHDHSHDHGHDHGHDHTHDHKEQEEFDHGHSHTHASTAIAAPPVPMKKCCGSKKCGKTVPK